MTWLNDLRILAALAIIFVHVAQASLNVPDDINSIAWWTGNLYLSFSLWGVPVFVMISGALLLSPQREYPTLSSFYMKRINRLLIPVLFWTIFYISWSYLRSVVNDREFDVEQMLSNLLSGRPYPHMWYLYMALGLYVFTPYLRKIVRHSTEFELFLLSAIAIFISMLSLATGTSPHRATVFIQLFPLYLGYFFAGHLIFSSNIKIKTRYLGALFILFALLTAAGHYLETALFGSSHYFYRNFSITIVPMSIVLMFIIKNIHPKIPINQDVRSNLAVFSLGAYLIHPAVFDVVKTLHYFGLNPQTYTLLMIPFTVFCVTLCSLVIAYAFSKLPLLQKTI